MRGDDARTRPATSSDQSHLSSKDTHEHQQIDCLPSFHCASSSHKTSHTISLPYPRPVPPPRQAHDSTADSTPPPADHSRKRHITRGDGRLLELSRHVKPKQQHGHPNINTNIRLSHSHANDHTTTRPPPRRRIRNTAPPSRTSGTTTYTMGRRRGGQRRIGSEIVQR